MTLTPIQRSRIEAVIQGLQALLEEDKPQPIVDTSTDFVAVEETMARLGLTWQSPRVVAFVTKINARENKPADKRYLSPYAIAALKAKLEAAECIRPGGT